MSAIDEVKQRTDIVEVVGQYIKLTKSGRNFRAVCPFHDEKTPSFFVFPERQSWHCFGACGTGGDAFSFVMKRENVDFAEALRRLADSAGVTLPSRKEPDTKKEARERILEANRAAEGHFHDLLLNSAAGAKAKAYLLGRGIDAESMDRFGLGYALESWDGLKRRLVERGYAEEELVEAGLLSSNETGRVYDRWRDRLMIPIKDDRGRTTGFGARALGATDGPKYINSPQTPVFDKSATIYGLDLAGTAIRKQDAVVIVEGYMDVITAHQYGFSNVVASMGTSITEKQISALKRLTRNVVLALDPDSAGEEAMLRCVSHENALEAEIRMVVLPEGKDPDDVIKADATAWRDLISGARPVMDFAFERVAARLDLTKVRDRSQARDLLYPVVDGIADVVRRAHYVKKLAFMVGIGERSLEASSKKSAGAGRSRPTVVSSQEQGKAALFKNPLEEYCLTLLLNHPELRKRGVDLPADYFENSENRELFATWKDSCDCSPEALKSAVSVDIRDHLEQLTNRSIPLTNIGQKYDYCVLRLREKLLRGLEKKREAVLALEAESGGTAAELAKLQEQGSGVSAGLRQVFGLKAGAKGT